jgi:hypothetical protein
MKLATFVLLALATPVIAADPHAHQIPGGWWECDSGYVSKPQTGGAICVPQDEALADRFVVSSLPSAGDGSRQVTRSSAPQPAPQPAYDGSFVTRSGWLYTPGTSAYSGGTLSRGGIGSRTVIALPPPW